MQRFVYSFPSVVIIAINQAAVIPSWAAIFVSSSMLSGVSPAEGRRAGGAQMVHAPRTT